jgi:hypothetical protein
VNRARDNAHNAPRAPRARVAILTHHAITRRALELPRRARRAPRAARARARARAVVNIR